MPDYIAKIINSSLRGRYKHLLDSLEHIVSAYETIDYAAFYSKECLRVGPVLPIREFSFHLPGWRMSANPEGFGSYTPVTEDDKKKIKKLISLRTKIVGYDLMKEERGWE